MPLSYWHGHATTSRSRANLLAFCLFFCLDEGTVVPPQARAVPTFWRFRCKNFPFLESVVDDYLQNNEKQTKRKAIKCVGCLPQSALLMSLA